MGRIYARIALDAYGGLPQPCHFCTEPVESIERGKGVVHHVDGDRTNHDPQNLAFAHHSCHTDHHMRASGAWQDPERRRKIGEANRRRWADPIEAEKMIAPRRGVPNPRVSDANRKSWADPAVRARRVAGLRRHRQR